MPGAVKAYLHEDFGELDSGIPSILEWMKATKVFKEFAHGRDPFIVHLTGTWGMLRCWGQPVDVARCGLLHSAYTRDGFFFRYFDIKSPQSRANLASLLGESAERQIYNYCYPGPLWDEREWDEFRTGDGHIDDRPSAPHLCRLGEPLNPAGYDIPSRVDAGKTIHLSPKDMANYMVVWVCDIADQWSEANTYRDVYHEDCPQRLWPGTGRPSMPYALFSRMLRTAAPYLDVVPPVFNNCTEVISIANEFRSCALYWRAVQGEQAMKPVEIERLFRQSAELNPYVGEPHAMLSQCLFNRGAFAEAAHHACCAIDMFQQWATHQDKRVLWSQWLGFSRMMLLRAKRRGQGLPMLPSSRVAREGLSEPDAVYLQDVVAEFDDHTQEAEAQAAELRSRL